MCFYVTIAPNHIMKCKLSTVVIDARNDKKKLETS